MEAIPFLVDAAKVRRQVEEWRKHLLDLTADNPLLCLERSRSSRLLVSSPEVRRLLEHLKTGKKLELPHISVVGRGKDQKISFEPGDLSFALRRNDRPEPDYRKDPPLAAELRKKLRRLYENARASLQERGIWTLHLAIGLLRWKDERLGEASSPVLLLPCELQRARGSGRMTLSAGDDEVYLNPALRLYLQTYLKVQIEDPTDTDDLPALDDWLGHWQPFNRADLERQFQLLKEVWLATFHFESLALYEDLGRLVESATGHPVAADLAGALSDLPGDNPVSVPPDTYWGVSLVKITSFGTSSVRTGAGTSVPGTATSATHSRESGGGPAASPEPLPVCLLPVHPGADGRHLVPLGTPMPVLETDSSQYRAVALASHCHNLVLHGPPGTGKSQTIASIIADALAQDRTVLFVSAKMAALEVVYARLRQLGLDRFCLEIHGLHSRRSRVVSELGSALEEARNVRVAPNGSAWKDFQRLSEKLDRLADQLHTKRGAMEISLLEALDRLSELSEQLAQKDPAAEHRASRPGATLPWVDPLMATRGNLEECCEALRDLAGCSSYATRTQNCWYGFDRTSVSQRELETIAHSLAGASSTCRVTQEALHPIIAASGGSFRPTLENTARLASLLAGFGVFDSLPRGWPLKSSTALQAEAEQLLLAASRARIHEKLQERLRRFSSRPPGEVHALLQQFHPLFATPLRFLMPGWHRWKKKAGRSFNASVCFTRALARDVAKLARVVERLETWYKKRCAKSNALAGKSLAFNADVLSAERELCLRAASLREGLERLGLPANACFESDGRPAQHAVELARLHENRSFEQIAALCNEWRGGLLDPSSIAKFTISEIAGRIETLSASLNSDAGKALKEWTRLNALLRRCRELKLDGFLQRYGDELPATLALEFEFRFWSLWIDAVLESSGELSFASSSHGKKLLHKLEQADARARRESLELALSSASQAASSCHSAGSMRPELEKALRFLRREIAKQRNHFPIRRLFAEAWDAITLLKPCLMMSPLSVSSYLPPRIGLFDLVIFDEASQIPTPEALPAILRARQVIVAGDSMQLPPTSFFRSALPDEDVDETDADVAEDGEGAETEQAALPPLASILEECKTAGRAFIEAYLRWHYRSRDERLILFSNQHFYGNRLITFPSPSPSSQNLGVRFVHVPDGLYERGGRRANIPEAKVVAQQIAELTREFPERSIGVVTLNLNQAEAIEDELQSLGGDVLARLEGGRPEPFFIKPLENVQGDERDIIVISLGYGYHLETTTDERNSNSQTVRRLFCQFGPISHQGGEKRLNVLITRARYLCVVVSSLRATDLESNRLKGDGAKRLRDFLHYAESGGCAAPVGTSHEEKQPAGLHGVLAEVLARRGLRTGLLVGDGNVRIPLAAGLVGSKAAEDGYRFAIECFGWQQPHLSDARDREILWPAVLERLGWRYLRFWPIDWLEDRWQTAEELARQCLRCPD